MTKVARQRGISRRRLMQAGAVLAIDGTLPRATAAEQTVLNDASRLNPTPVFRHWIVQPSEQAELIAKLRNELKAAAAEGRPLCVGAARHSMGGQSLPRHGLAITVNSARCEPDTSAKTFRADAGTRWHHVIAALDRIGFSPAVMQSNHDFGVAATFSVNAHGWPVPYGPFGSTVRSLRLMLADGTVVSCSRTENQELFQLAMGGYGLIALGAGASGPVALQIRSVVAGLDAADVAADGRIKIVRALAGGASVIETPRYRAFTEVLAGLAARGRSVAEIAGNDDVLITVLAPQGKPADKLGRPLFEVPLQARPGWRRIGLDVKVPALASVMRQLRELGMELEHVYDY